MLPYSLHYLRFGVYRTTPYLPNDMSTKLSSLEILCNPPNEDGCTERFKNKNK